MFATVECEAVVFAGRDVRADVAEGVPLRRFQGRWVASLAVSPDGRTLAVGPYHTAVVLYDLVKPSKAMRKPTGEWNHIVITCDNNLIEVELNGEKVTRMDLDQWTKAYKRPDGTPHKFDIAFKDHPRLGYIGLQDHGANCWFKNIKVKLVK